MDGKLLRGNLRGLGRVLTKWTTGILQKAGPQSDITRGVVEGKEPDYMWRVIRYAGWATPTQLP